MRKDYDFSKGRKNPHAKRLKKQATRRSKAATDAGDVAESQHRMKEPGGVTLDELQRKLRK